MVLCELIAGEDHNVGNGIVVRRGEPMPPETLRWHHLGRLITRGAIAIREAAPPVIPAPPGADVERVQSLPLDTRQEKSRPEPPVSAKAKQLSKRR